MKKPFSIARAELARDLINRINDSGIPPSVTADILAGLLQQAQAAAQEQLEADMREYEAAMEERKKVAREFGVPDGMAEMDEQDERRFERFLQNTQNAANDPEQNDHEQKLSETKEDKGAKK